VAGDDGRVPVDPSSDVYKEFARLYRITQEMHPGGADLWNGELYARTDDKWGGLARDGTMSLNKELVLDHLTGGELSDDPQRQAQALATVLHESEHARAPMDAPHEPNALRARESIGLDEGFTELSAMDDFEEFVQRAGYDGVPQPEPEYQGAVLASRELLERATSSEEERKQLLDSAMDKPGVMRWDAVADHIVRTELADVVPPDPEHQQAARAHLVNEMATPEWAGVQHRPNAGRLTSDLTQAGVDRAVGQLREHYEQNPGEPYPAKVPNPQAALTAQSETARQQNQERERAISSPDLDSLPPPAAETRVDVGRGAEPTQSGPAPAAAHGERRQSVAASQGPQAQQAGRGGQDDMMRFIGGQAPAAQATQHRPSLGDGSRGAGAPAAARLDRPGVGRSGPAPDRGRE
jgi:hypothetical protein